MGRKSAASLAGAALVKHRWKNSTAEERSATARVAVTARWKDATEEERLAVGQKLAEARAAAAAKKGKKK